MRRSLRMSFRRPRMGWASGLFSGSDTRISDGCLPETSPSQACMSLRTATVRSACKVGLPLSAEDQTSLVIANLSST